MDDTLYRLETRIKSLMQECEQLKQANLKLRQLKTLLTREKDTLLAKHKLAVSQIEIMVSRLKSIEERQ